ncbi:hypothetical protein DSL72_000061 [Monilinia vaccinii-corymbosi]|uniref:Uncharacterized protein n=1 Tax=Monilinia vaccinii-corymbosi TaxID=61207 RepID=A0A8A3PA55_9HELO|nr:hypothetical protein DSL72_000061 [Monilinia vaccinii-corymbosi]
MAPVEVDNDPSVLPTVQLGGHILLASCLTVLVARTIYRSYLALPPSSATRHRQSLRRDHAKMFTSLALLGLMTAVWFGVKGASLSYRVWAAERGVELPDSFFGDKGALRLGQHPGRFEIIRWLNDTPFYRDNLEIVAEKARYFWWGQQASFALNSFSTYVAIEGRRRNISNLWAFVLLGQLVNVSFAQNLWFVAILLTPVPLPENVDTLTDTRRAFASVHKLWFEVVPQRANNWLPNPGFYITLLLSGYGALFLTPFAANTSSFGIVAFLSVAFPFAPLLLPYIIPEHWGTTHDRPHEAHSSYIKIFRVISTMSSILHIRTSGLALLYNTPDNHYYRHSLLHPLEKVHRSSKNRAFTALERVLGAVGDHPAVGAVGYDVILSGLSLGTWAAVRGLDGYEILRTVIPWMNKVGEAGVRVKEEVESTAQSTDTPSPVRRRGRPRKSIKSQQDAAYAPKSSANGAATEGDQVEDEDWEIAALMWGVVSAAGLGVGSAGVYGAEMTAR